MLLNDVLTTCEGVPLLENEVKMIELTARAIAALSFIWLMEGFKDEG